MHILRLLAVAVIAGLALATGCDQAVTESDPATSPEGVADSAASPTEKPLKVGYINSVELLALMPDAVAADQEIQNFAAGQERRFQQLAQQYQAKVQEVQEQGASMTPMKQQVAVQEIQKLEKQIQEMQANSAQRVASRREELLSPVLERADSIIRAVAQANGYDLIYDRPALMMESARSSGWSHRK
jgi:outer membrane protein